MGEGYKAMFTLDFVVGVQLTEQMGKCTILSLVQKVSRWVDIYMQISLLWLIHHS